MRVPLETKYASMAAAFFMPSSACFWAAVMVLFALVSVSTTSRTSRPEVCSARAVRVCRSRRTCAWGSLISAPSA